MVDGTENDMGKTEQRRFPEIVDRVLEIKDHYRLKNSDIDRAMGTTAGYTNRMMCMEKPLSTQHIVNFYNEYKFNIHWLFTGEGDMIIPPSAQGADGIHADVSPQEAAWALEFVRELKRKKQE